MPFQSEVLSIDRVAKMKLLGWMHRKFRQNSGEELKDLGGAAAGPAHVIRVWLAFAKLRSSACVVAGGTCNCLSGRPSLDLDLNRRRLSRYDALKARSLRLRVEAVNDGGDEGADRTVEEFFGGLLAIGTLGVGTEPIEEKREEEDMEDLAASEEVEGKALEAESEEALAAATPAALEAIAEKEAEATTETDLIMVSAELEKVLAAEEEKSGGRMSSARSSHAGAAACPLQGFLFGLPVEAAETALMAEEAAGGSRKEKRASLGELFLMSRIIEEREGTMEGESKLVGVDGQGKLTAEMCLAKKKHRGRKGSDGVHASNGSTVEKKFQKILQLFHKKVHPESSTAIISKKFSKTGRTEKEHYVPGHGGSSDSKVITTSKATNRKQNTSISVFADAPSSASSVSDSSGKSNGEHWIKTDAEYLVLEL
ncbi:hypothetical protein ZIOFF_010603 [Zingiber officinale]|uniref:Protein LAZY 1 n=1 Tax=Zingiber officinale TaxID=94328 RepID=A0A8J5HH74_ZINOF|nr:hypothetical protein ZIOFF_010603 [Zingiber officinale]